MDIDQNITSDLCSIPAANLEAVLFSDYVNNENTIISSEHITDLSELEGTLCYDEATNEFVFINMIQPNVITNNDLLGSSSSGFSLDPVSSLIDMPPFTEGHHITLLNSAILLPGEDSTHASTHESMLFQLVQTPTEYRKPNEIPTKEIDTTHKILKQGSNLESNVSNEQRVETNIPSDTSQLCAICRQSFANSKAYKTHILRHKIEDKAYMCNSCGISFNKIVNLKLHQVIHNADNLVCPSESCGKKFRRLASLKAHIKVHEEDEILFCPKCGEEFSNQTYLELHLETRSQCRKPGDISAANIVDEKRCNICNRKFDNENDLAAHRREHKKINNALATKCPKKKRSQTNPSKKINRCKYCPKWFHKPSQLERHQRIHTGERPYKCDICEKAFSQRCSLSIHMLKHTGDRPFTCQFCRANFSQRGNLRQHIARVHSIRKVEEQVYQCSECPCNFRKICSLNAHKNRVHVKKCVTIGNKVTGQISKLPKKTVISHEDEDSDECDNDLNGKCDKNEKSSKLSKPIPEIAFKKEGRMFICMFCPSIFKDKTEINSHNCQTVKCDEIRAGKANQYEIYEKDLENCLPDITSMNEIKVSIERGTGETWDYLVYVVQTKRGRYYKCSHCTRKSQTLSEMVRHIKTNVVGKHFKCEHCSLTFSKSSIFLTHLKLHSTAASYPCSECDKRFPNPAELKLHSKAHSKKKNDQSNSVPIINGQNSVKRIMQDSVCVLCRQPYSSTDAAPHVCHQSTIKNDTNISRKKVEVNAGKHIQTVQDKVNLILPPYKCNRCLITFSSYTRLKSHLQFHDGILCQICLSIFVCEEEYMEHTRSEHPNEHNSNTRDKSFSISDKPDKLSKLTTKKYSHSFKCSMCDEEFVQKDVLKCHVIKEHASLLPSDPYMHVDSVENSSTFQRNPTENLCDGDTVSGFISPHTTPNHIAPNNLDKAPSVISDTISRHYTVKSMKSTCSESGMNDKNNATTIADDHFTEQVNTDKNLTFVISSESFSSDCIESRLQVPKITNDVSAVSKILAHNERADIVHKCSNCSLECSSRSALQEHQHNSPTCHIRSPSKELDCFYSCNTCFLTFICLTTFLKHLQTHKDKNTHLCLFCNIPHKTEIDLTQHIARHAEKNEFPCIHCGELGDSAEAVKKHITEVHLLSSSKALKTKESISQMRLSEKQKNHFIRQSASKFTSISHKVLSTLLKKKKDTGESGDENTQKEMAGKSNVTNKRNLSSNKKENICSYCGRVFKKSCDLIRHIRTHTGEKPFKCDQCDKSFRVKSILNGHLKRHFTVNNICCHICHRFFSTVGSLKIHMRLHTGDFPYKCSFCSKTFRTSGHCESHQKRHSVEQERAKQVALASAILNKEKKTIGGVISLYDNNISIPDIRAIDDFRFQDLDLDLLTKSSCSISFHGREDLANNYTNSKTPVVESICNVNGEKCSSTSSVQDHLRSHPPVASLFSKNEKKHEMDHQSPVNIRLPFEDDSLSGPAIALENNKWDDDESPHFSNLVPARKSDLSDFLIMGKQFDFNSMISEFYNDHERNNADT